MAIEAIRWHDPGSVFDGFASPGPERPSGSWIQLVTRCHEPHMKQHIQSYLQSIHQYPYSIPGVRSYIPAPLRAQMFPADFGHLCERLRRAQGRGPSPEKDRGSLVVI